MALSLVTAPQTEPISLVEAKAHLRVDVDDENDLINTLRSVSREYGETFTHRAFVTQTWNDVRGGFPGDDEAIWLPRPPLISVTSVTYLDTAGVSQTWSSSLYTVTAPAGPKASAGSIVPNYGQIYPATRDVVNAVTIRFVAGYGAATEVPALIKTCLKEHVRANYGRGIEKRDEILTWIDRHLWAYKAF
jgi:phage conserved hypothetical protein, phiE125 gp8 family